MTDRPEQAPPAAPSPQPSPSQPISSADAGSPKDSALAAPLALWLVVQMVALVASAARVPFWARFTQPAEDLALHVMLVTQLCAAALLAPILFGTWSRTICVLLTAIVFVQLSALLAAAGTAVTILAALYVACWLLALATWISATRCNAVAGAIVVIIASCFTIGGTVLLYARRELSDEAIGPL